CFQSPALSLALCSTIALTPDEKGGVTAEFSLGEGQAAIFLLAQVAVGDSSVHVLSAEEEASLFTATVQYWRRWIARCTYRGRWREMVYRSALVLKLLTYQPTGAIVAAPTCSLPERIGGIRNWDYRYTWLRDAAFTLYALMRIGFVEEAARFMDWLAARCAEASDEGGLQIMYGIDGRHRLDETLLTHLDGYMGSRPVRLGNGAFDQLQLDIYGEVLDAVYLYNKYGAHISYELWQQLVRLLNLLCTLWRQPDEGIWEVRGGRKHFVYSKMMCWVAFDRALRIADFRGLPAPREQWRETQSQIYREVMDRGWNAEKRSFVQHYDSAYLDA